MKLSRIKAISIYVATICLLFQSHLTFAASVKLPTGTRVYVSTKQDLIGKGEQVRQGQSVRAEVWRGDLAAQDYK